MGIDGPRVRLLFVLIALAGSPAVAAADDVPVPRARPRVVIPAEPRSFAEAVAGLDFNSAEVTSAPSDCQIRLDGLALFEPVPRLIGPGSCGGPDMVRLHAVFLRDKTSVSFNPPPHLRCRMAEAVAHWVRDDLVTVFRNPVLRSVEGAGSYECRGRNRIAGAKVSEHGKGNALDIHSVKLADGSSLYPTDLLANRDLRETLKAGACARFSTVLGPGSDGYHEEHVHLDLAERRGGYTMCQWAVRVPSPSGVVTGDIPLPPPRPAIAEPETADEETEEP